MTLLQDQDQLNLSTDPSILVVSADGRQQPVLPFKLSQQPIIRREPQGIPRSYPGVQTPQPAGPQQSSTPTATPLATNGTSISVPQMKKMQPSIGLPRVPANGGMRPPALPAAATMLTNGSAPHSSPPHIGIQPNSVNGINHTSVGHVPANPDPVPNPSIANGTSQAQPDSVPVSNDNCTVSPVRPKSQDQHRPPVPNGYHLTTVNGYTSMVNGSFLHHPNAQLSMQQVQTLKSAFQDVNALQTNATRPLPPVSFMGHVVGSGTNFNMSLNGGGNPKLPAARQMWASPPLQRTAGSNGVEIPLSSPAISHSVPGPPARTPSSNGSRNGMRGVQSSHVIGQGHTHVQHSPSPMPLSLSAQGQPSPPRLPQTPTMTMVSPSLQHQQPVGSSQSGY
jgi:enhancer of polycomb-like protein